MDAQDEMFVNYETQHPGSKLDTFPVGEVLVYSYCFNAH